MIGFVALRGLSFPQATAQTKVMNLTSNVVALVWFAAHGDVVWPLGLAIGIAANVAGAATGSSLAVEKGAPLIRAFFLVAVAATLVHLARRSLGICERRLCREACPHMVSLGQFEVISRPRARHT